MNNSKTYNILGVDIECVSYRIQCNSHIEAKTSIDEYYSKNNLLNIDTSVNKDIYQAFLYMPEITTILTANEIDGIIHELKNLTTLGENDE